MSSEESNILVLNDFPMDSPLAGSQWRWQRFFRRGSGRKYYCTTDRIHELPVPGGGDDYGLLPKALYDGDLVDKAGTSGAEEKASIRRDAALEFLRSARVVVLSTDEAHEDLIRVLENVVGCAADILLRTTHSDVRQTIPSVDSGLMIVAEHFTGDRKRVLVAREIHHLERIIGPDSNRLTKAAIQLDEIPDRNGLRHEVAKAATHMCAGRSSGLCLAREISHAVYLPFARRAEIFVCPDPPSSTHDNAPRLITPTRSRLRMTPVILPVNRSLRSDGI